MLSATDEDVRRLIRMRRIQHRESDDTVLLDDIITVLELCEFDAIMDRGGSEKEARKRAEAVRANLEKQARRNDETAEGPNSCYPSYPNATNNSSPLTTHHSPLTNIEGGSFWHDGLEWLTVEQSSRLLKVGRSQIYALLSARLNSEKRDGRRWILREDVESYRRLQKIWQEKGGDWTPYGRAESVRQASVQPVGDRRSRAGRRPNSDESDAYKYWIKCPEAAAILALSPTQVNSLAREGKLIRHIGERPGPGRPYEYKKGYWPSWFSMQDVLRHRNERDRKRPCISPAEWNRNLRHPIIRTVLEAPPGDELVPSLEAARILGVGRATALALVASGKLFGWQKEPGKQGSRVWFSLNQVCRFAERTERKTYRSAWNNRRVDGRGQLQEWEDKNIDPLYVRLPSAGTKKDRGEYFTSRQAAIAMGLSPHTVRNLRKRGRLQGHQRVPRKNQKARRSAWWFFRKDDVYALLADHDYRKNHKRATGADPKFHNLE